MELYEKFEDLNQKLKSNILRLTPESRNKLNTIFSTAEEFGKAWSGSWLGYHSRVYYTDFKVPPPGARFSKEWGFMDTFASYTVGDWIEYNFEDVRNAIYLAAENKDISNEEQIAKEVKEDFEDIKSETQSLFYSIKENYNEDKFLETIIEELDKCKIYSIRELALAFQPTGQQISRDAVAIQSGLIIPPHISVYVEIQSIRNVFDTCEKLSKLIKRAGSHIKNITEYKAKASIKGMNVFFGHGRSKEWKDLKDFIQERLHLPWDEFNRVPVAGYTNITRLSQMLDNAVIAFLIMTAEDEQIDNKYYARQNVIHEAGLFQGRLGFERAIIILEDGCEEFSNVQGLGQIRFPKGNIGAIFEDVRRILEREGLVEES